MLHEFANQVALSLEDMIPDTDITVKEVDKPGEKHMTGIIIHSKGNSVAPIIYIDDAYDRYREGASLEGICEQLKNTYENTFMGDLDLDALTKWDEASKRVCARLVSPTKNESYIKNKICTPVPNTDIAVMYYVDINDLREGASIPVSDDNLFKGWGIDVSTLHETAMSNTVKRTNPNIFSLGSMFGDNSTNANSTVVITNESSQFGAILALMPEIHEQIKEAVGDFYLLPSSVHEMLAIPKSMPGSAEELLEMVKQINSTEVSDEDFLADDVFTVQDGQLTSVFN